MREWIERIVLAVIITILIFLVYVIDNANETRINNIEQKIHNIDSTLWNCVYEIDDIRRGLDE